MPRITPLAFFALALLLFAWLGVTAYQSWPLSDYKESTRIVALMERHYRARDKETPPVRAYFIIAQPDENDVWAITYELEKDRKTTRYKSWKEDHWKRVGDVWVVDRTTPPSASTIHGWFGDSTYNDPKHQFGDDFDKIIGSGRGANRRGIWRWRTPLTDWAYEKLPK